MKEWRLWGSQSKKRMNKAKVGRKKRKWILNTMDKNMLS